MTAGANKVALGEVADVNPTWFEDCIDTDEEVAFVPMAAVSAETAQIEKPQIRKLGDVLQGFPWFSDGDVLVAKITPCFENGKIAQARIAQRYGFGSTEFHVLSPGANLDARYLLHFLRQKRVRTEGARRMTGSAGQRRVPKHFLEKLEIPLPPLAEQRRIAEVLDRAETLRAKRRAALAQLDSLTQSLFLDLFGDPVESSRWPTHVVQDIASSAKYSIVDGPFGSSIKPNDYRDSGVPVVRITNITKAGYFDAKNLLFVEESQFNKLRRSSIAGGDVLVSRVGTLGNTCIFPRSFGPALLSTTGVCKITLNQKRMLPQFFHVAMRMPSFQRQIEKSASTSVQKYFNLSALKNWKIIVPPVERQREFSQQMTAVESMKKLQRIALAELDELFRCLQTLSFTGRLWCPSSTTDLKSTL